MILTKIQLDIAKEIINIGLAKAADSMSFFMKNPVLLRDFDVQVRALSGIEQLSRKKGDNINVLTTELKGEMGGVCFLLIDEKDADVLYSTALPESIKSDPNKMAQMGVHLLLEIDNIVSAAVITQLANMLKYNVHGHVPEHQAVSENELEQSIRKKITLEDYIFYIAVRFQVPGSLFCPEFIWALDSVFVEGIKRFIDDPININVIQNMTK